MLHKSDACNEGQFVKAGTPLFEIDPRDYQLDVERLEQELKQAGHAIEEIDEELVQNATSIELADGRWSSPSATSPGSTRSRPDKIVTESEHDRSLREELTAANALTALEGQKRVLAKRRNRFLEAQALAATMLEKAQLDLSRTQIAAPIDGIVVEDKVEQDSFVSKGTPLVTIEDTRAAEVKHEPADGRRGPGAGAAAARRRRAHGPGSSTPRRRSCSTSATPPTSGRACCRGRRAAGSMRRPARSPAGCS